MRVNSITHLVFNRYFFQKILALAILVLLAYLLKQFVFLFLVTFLFAYLFLSFWEFLFNKTSGLIHKIWNKSVRNFLKSSFTLNKIVFFLYLLFIGLIIFAISDLLPKIIQELTELPKSMPFLSNQVKEVLSKLEEIKTFKQDLKWTFQTLLTASNYDIILKFLWNIKTAWMVLIEFIISLVMSYVFIIDRLKIKAYLEEMKKWNFAFLYYEYSVIFQKVSNWFGMIFKAQSIISFANTILTVIWLYIISFVHGTSTFPYIFTLAIVVFIFWMVPVLGMFLSSVPIIMIWFSYGWIPVILEIILLITIIHLIEAYYLNPRIVSSYAELPISLTFLILILSEQFFWMAWLLVWVPLFYIIVDTLKDFDAYIWNVKRAYTHISELKTETKKKLEKDIRLSRSWKKSV